MNEVSISDAIALSNALRLSPSDAVAVCGDLMELVAQCERCGNWHKGGDLPCFACRRNDRIEPAKIIVDVEEEVIARYQRKRERRREYARDLCALRARHRALKRGAIAKIHAKIF